MGFFDRKNQNPGPPAPQAQNASKYSVENINRLLDSIGLLRLRVIDIQVKTYVTTIAWKTPDYIARQSQGGQLPGRITAELQEQLAMLINVLNTYIDIQDNPERYAVRGNPEELQEQGSESLRKFAERLEDTNSITNAPDITGYTVDTKILATFN